MAWTRQLAGAFAAIAALNGIALSLVAAGPLRAGVAKINITVEDPTGSGAGVANPLYVRALVLENGETRAAIIAIDALMIGGGGTGQIRELSSKDYIREVRNRIEEEFEIVGEHVLVNASHNHNSREKIRTDVLELTVQAVKEASEHMVEVKTGAGSGFEDRLTMNRTLMLKDGTVASICKSYPTPLDSEIASVGPIDPEIGILRIDRADGTTLAVLYNFACHAIADLIMLRGQPITGSVSADYPGVASRVIEETLGNDVVAFFLQGCAGDINTPVYASSDEKGIADPFGNRLGLSTLRAVKEIPTAEDGALNVISETLELPRRTDYPERIETLEKEQAELLDSLASTNLNFRTFFPLYLQHSLNPDYPGHYAFRYLHEAAAGRDDLVGLDAANKRDVEKYLESIHVMERLGKNQFLLRVLKARQARSKFQGPTVSIEVQGMRIGEWVLVTFPGEPYVEIGMNIKERSPFEHTFVAGYSNDYIGYAATADVIRRGGDYGGTLCILAPQWQKIFEAKALEIIGKL